MLHLAEADYFWRYVPLDLVAEMFERFSKMMTPVYSDRAALDAIVLLFSTQLTGALQVSH